MGGVASTTPPTLRTRSEPGVSTSRHETLTSGSEVCAVLVTFHPDEGLPARIERVLLEVGALVIVDNGSDEAALGMLRRLAADPRIVLVLNFANLGIARALNLGIARAGERGYAWVLLLDQDSVIDAGMLNAMIEIRAAYPAADRLAVIGAGFRDVNKNAGETRAARADKEWEEVESVITSGSLIALATHAAVGPFREEFFIDYVDSDYCFRARALGYRVIRTRRALMSHAIGAATRHSIFGVDKWTSNHSPDRRYYIARNDTVMLHEYGHYALGLWAAKSLGRCIRACKRVLLYEPMKAAKIHAILQGWWHGVCGRLGPRAR
jgi:rhamnosyltransferase